MSEQLKSAIGLRGAVPHGDSILETNGTVSAIGRWSTITAYNGSVSDLTFKTGTSAGSTFKKYQLNLFNGNFDPTAIQMLYVQFYSEAIMNTNNQGAPMYVKIGRDIATGDCRRMVLGGPCAEVEGYSVNSTYSAMSAKEGTLVMIPVLPGDVEIEIEAKLLQATTGTDFSTVKFLSAYTLTSGVILPTTDVIYLAGSRTSHVTHNTSNGNGYIDSATQAYASGVGDQNIIRTSRDTIQRVSWSGILPLQVDTDVKRTVIRGTFQINGHTAEEDSMALVLDIDWQDQTFVCLVYGLTEYGTAMHPKIHTGSLAEGLNHTRTLQFGLRYAFATSGRSITKLPWPTFTKDISWIPAADHLCRACYEITNYRSSLVHVPIESKLMPEMNRWYIKGGRSSSEIGYVDTNSSANEGDGVSAVTTSVNQSSASNWDGPMPLTFASNIKRTVIEGYAEVKNGATFLDTLHYTLDINWFDAIYTFTVSGSTIAGANRLESHPLAEDLDLTCTNDTYDARFVAKFGNREIIRLPYPTLDGVSVPSVNYCITNYMDLLADTPEAIELSPAVGRTNIETWHMSGTVATTGVGNTDGYLHQDRGVGSVAPISSRTSATHTNWTQLMPMVFSDDVIKVRIQGETQLNQNGLVYSYRLDLDFIKGTFVYVPVYQKDVGDWESMAIIKGNIADGFLATGTAVGFKVEFKCASNNIRSIERLPWPYRNSNAITRGNFTITEERLATTYVPVVGIPVVTEDTIYISGSKVGESLYSASVTTNAGFLRAADTPQPSTTLISSTLPVSDNTKWSSVLPINIPTDVYRTVLICKFASHIAANDEDLHEVTVDINWGAGTFVLTYHSSIGINSDAGYRLTNVMTGTVGVRFQHNISSLHKLYVGVHVASRQITELPLIESLSAVIINNVAYRAHENIAASYVIKNYKTSPNGVNTIPVSGVSGAIIELNASSTVGGSYPRGTYQFLGGVWTCINTLEKFQLTTGATLYPVPGAYYEISGSDLTGYILPLTKSVDFPLGKETVVEIRSASAVTINPTNITIIGAVTNGAGNARVCTNANSKLVIRRTTTGLIGTVSQLVV